MRVLVPLLAVLLAGCAECGLQPQEVAWRDPDFGAALLDAPAPGWTVRSVPPRPGIPSDDPDIAAWNATVQHVLHPLGDRLRLVLDYAGRLDLGAVREPADEEALRDRVVAALADATDGNETERRAWTDALLEGDLGRSWSRPGPNGTEVRERSYRTLVPVDRIRVDGIVAGNVPDEPTPFFEAGDWWVSVALPTVEAVRGSRSFHAETDGNRFEDADWQGEFPEEEALAAFEAAYVSLGVGAPPRGAGVHGDIC